MLPLLTILSNATQGNTLFQNFWNVNITDCLIAGSAVIALIFGVITASKWQSKQTKIADKQYQLSAFLEIIKIMDDPEQKDARRTLDAVHNNQYQREFYQTNFDKVRSSFDIIGMLYYQKAVPEEMIFLSYWYTIIQCWNYLLPYITDIRKNDNLSLFAKPFEILKDGALEYHKKNYPTYALPK